MWFLGTPSQPPQTCRSAPKRRSPEPACGRSAIVCVSRSRGRVEGCRAGWPPWGQRQLRGRERPGVRRLGRPAHTSLSSRASRAVLRKRASVALAVHLPGEDDWASRGDSRRRSAGGASPEWSWRRSRPHPATSSVPDHPGLTIGSHCWIILRDERGRPGLRGRRTSVPRLGSVHLAANRVEALPGRASGLSLTTEKKARPPHRRAFWARA